ncbi:MAG: hypothetical protein EOP10_00740 [Proteobacteria bacterium]|nr:MAG: hypothetical protein EOP10_00740 [Pseudomonadota bacterium]
MIFCCSVDAQDYTHSQKSPSFQSLCRAFTHDIRKLGYLRGAYQGGTIGLLKRRQFGEIYFEDVNLDSKNLLALWLIEARDLNHMIAMVDSHPVLSSFGIKICELGSDERDLI